MRCRRLWRGILILLYKILVKSFALQRHLVVSCFFSTSFLVIQTRRFVVEYLLIMDIINSHLVYYMRAHCVYVHICLCIMNKRKKILRKSNSSAKVKVGQCAQLIITHANNYYIVHDMRVYFFQINLFIYYLSFKQVYYYYIY